ncbi:MAG: SDR family oxidoreductase [Erysipelotrichaceae bacterium]|nr:SDR family oxidoreductase [Erysipelotrichaceae bacterium]
MSTVLITGASNGIGEACARLLAKKGYDLILTARNTYKMETIRQAILEDYDVHFDIIKCDLAVLDSAQELYNEVNRRHLDVDILINNAGFGDQGAFLESDWQKQKEMVLLNVMSLIQLSYLFGNQMKDKGQGRILNVASIAAFCSGPYMSIYYATKAFVLSFSDALSRELEGTGITVTCLCPGPTATGFMERANLGDSPMFSFFKPAHATDVAKLGLKAMFKGKTLVIHSVGGHLLNLAVRVAPRVVVEKCMVYVNGKRTID